LDYSPVARVQLTADVQQMYRTAQACIFTILYTLYILVF
jgi:hypothetical protein